MKWFSKQNALVAVRCAVVLGGIGVGATMPPPANAIEHQSTPGANDSARPLESFVNVARAPSDRNGVPIAPRSVLEEVDSGTARDRAGGAASSDDDSFARWTRTPRVVDESSHYMRGDGFDHFHGGGWPFDREYFNNRHSWPTAAVPEIRATTLTLIGLGAVALMVKRQRRRRAFWAH